MGTASNSFSSQLYKSMDLKDTQELLDILKANNKEEWTEAAFEAIKEVLRARNIAEPEPDLPVTSAKPEQSAAPTPSMLRDPSISAHLQDALSYLERRKYKDAALECDAVLKIIPDLSVAQELRKLIQDRKTLYSRGGFSILFGIALLYSLFSAMSNSRGEPTSLGSMALGLGIFLLLEGLVVALSGMRTGFLIDGIAICVVGLWNLGTSLFTGSVNLLFAGLGVFQLYWGVTGVIGYGRKPALSFREIKQQINNVTDALEEKGSPQAMDLLVKASSAYENEKNPNKILQMCDSVLQLEPGLASAHNLRAMVLEDLKRPEEAIMAYREALRLEPAFSDAQGNLSDLERRMKK